MLNIHIYALNRRFYRNPPLRYNAIAKEDFLLLQMRIDLLKINGHAVVGNKETIRLGDVFEVLIHAVCPVV